MTMQCPSSCDCEKTVILVYVLHKGSNYYHYHLNETISILHSCKNLET